MCFTEWLHEDVMTIARPEVVSLSVRHEMASVVVASPDTWLKKELGYLMVGIAILAGERTKY